MIIAVVVVLVLVGLVGAVAAFGLRRVFLEEEVAESRVRTGDAHTVEYVMPAGIDPADLRAAVSAAGFSAAVVSGASGDRLRVVCAEHDRARLREAIEDTHSASSGGAHLHLGPVVFVDERPAQGPVEGQV